MNALLPVLTVALAAVLAAPAALAGPRCTDAPRSEWLPAKTMRDRITSAGYAIDEFKVSGSCYEIYGKDRTGRKVEIYYDPTDGRVVKQRDQD